MFYTFPTPKEVPHQVKQNVMNHVFPKQGSPLKRSFLIKAFSWYALFLWVVVLFSFVYLRPSSGTISESLVLSQNNQPEIPFHLVVSSQELDDIEVVLLETEELLYELENLI